MFQAGPKAIPMDLAIELSALYAVKRAKHTEIPSPALTVIPSLRELAVATLLDRALATGNGFISIPDSYRADMVSMLPPDIPLSRVFNIEEASYWIKRYRHEFDCSDSLHDIADVRTFYCESLLSRLLLRLASDTEDRDAINKQISELLTLAGQHIARLVLHTELYSVDTGNIFSRLPNLAHIQLVYAEAHVQSTMLLERMDAPKPSVADLLARSDSLTLKGKTLLESATKNSNPVAPFHQLPDYKLLSTFLHKDVYSTAIPGGCLIESNRKGGGTSERLLELLDTFRYIQKPLESFSIVDSALKDEAVNILARGLHDLLAKLQANNKDKSYSISCLDLSYNDIGDDALRTLSKLFVYSEKHDFPAVVTSLRLTSNCITKTGCIFLAKAIGQPHSRLEALVLANNNIGTDGYVLLANGILKTSIKYSNPYLTHLNVCDCNIVIDASILRITTKLIQRTTLECIELNGNIFAVALGQEAGAADGQPTIDDDPNEAILVGLRKLIEALKVRYLESGCHDGIFTGQRTPCVLTISDDLGFIPGELYTKLRELNHCSASSLAKIRASRRVQVDEEAISKPEVDLQ